MTTLICLACIALTAAAVPVPHAAEDLLIADSGAAKVGIDRGKGASITQLSWAGYPKNAVNSYDPGRLIQQSYYTGRRLDRRDDGQHNAWSPWSWNPIQGGGVGSWAKVPKFEKQTDGTFHSETVPKLWDMPDEEAAALMRQWTRFEPDMPEVVVVTCELVCSRDPDDRWGPARHASPQEVPATYFTRNFNTFKSYLGDGKWRTEPNKVGPPWNRTSEVPRHAMACFEKGGQGIAVFSPNAESWNYGPHAGPMTDDPLGGPCVHLAPVARAQLGPRTTYRYRYWLVVGSETEIANRLDVLWKKYQNERATLTNP